MIGGAETMQGAVENNERSGKGGADTAVNVIPQSP